MSFSERLARLHTVELQTPASFVIRSEISKGSDEEECRGQTTKVLRPSTSYRRGMSPIRSRDPSVGGSEVGSPLRSSSRRPQVEPADRSAGNGQQSVVRRAPPGRQNGPTGRHQDVEPRETASTRQRRTLPEERPRDPEREFRSVQSLESPSTSRCREARDTFATGATPRKRCRESGHASARRRSDDDRRCSFDSSRERSSDEGHRWTSSTHARRARSPSFDRSTRQRRGGRSRSPSPAVRPPSRPPAAAAIKVGSYDGANMSLETFLEKFQNFAKYYRLN